MTVIDILTICFILCLFSLGFKWLDMIKDEEGFEHNLKLAEEEIVKLRGDVEYLKSYVEHLRVQLTRLK